MKKLFLISFIFYFLVNGVFAQDMKTGYTPEERAEIINDWMNENLKPTDEQMPRLEALNLEYAKKMESVRQIDGKISQLKAAKNISDEKDQKLKMILTKDQFSTYQKKKSELRAMAKKRVKESK
jgi:hypothetical protein